MSIIGGQFIQSGPTRRRLRFPRVKSTANNRQSTNVTSHSITLPSDAAVGDLLLVFFACDGNPTIAINTTASGANWTALATNANSTVVSGGVYWKIAAGSDALTLNTTASEMSSHISYRITGANTVSGNSTNGSSTNSDPPDHAPAGGQREILWFTARMGDSTVNASAAPTNYTNKFTMTGSSTNAASTDAAYRYFDAANDNPGTWTSGNEQWVAFTVAVLPPEYAKHVI